MDGYIKNKTMMWVHAMKRSIGPLAVISLDELYKQYGKKHGLKEGPEFVNWLKNVKLKDKSFWEVVTKEDLDIKKKEVEKAKEIIEEKIIEKPVKVEEDVKMHPSKMSVEDVVGLSVRRAREVVPEIQDLNLLKYAVREASPRANKDTLCVILRKRITELEQYRRV
jgi:hypothetical protein